MPLPECNWCGSDDDLREHGAELLCWRCRDIYDENEAINESDKVKEDLRLMKG